VPIKILVTNHGDGTMDLKEYSKFLASRITSYVWQEVAKKMEMSRIEPETFTVVSDRDLPLQR
jgi:hypothetical protein